MVIKQDSSTGGHDTVPREWGGSCCQERVGGVRDEDQIEHFRDKAIQSI